MKQLLTSLALAIIVTCPDGLTIEVENAKKITCPPIEKENRGAWCIDGFGQWKDCGWSTAPWPTIPNQPFTGWWTTLPKGKGGW